MWLLFAFAAPMLWAISTHIDKFLVDRYAHRGDVGVLVVFTGMTGLIVAAAIWLLLPTTLALPLSSIALIVASGALSMLAMYFYLDALQTEDASAVAPWFQAAPLFGYALGYAVLGETLTPRQVLGGALIVGGTIVLSLGRGFRRGLNLRLAGFMLACAFTLALSTAIFKLFAVEDEFWSTTAWTSAGQALVGLLLLARGSTWRQLVMMLRGDAPLVVSVNAANEAINLAGSLAQRYALVLAPLSLVQAIGGTAPLFVFAFGLALSAVSPRLASEDLSPAGLLHKSIAALLVVAGVVLIGG
ncbi:MAG: EamA family transporter [Acetobacteraceae bacterium]